MNSTVKHQSRAPVAAMDTVSSDSLFWLGAFPVVTSLLFVFQPSLHASLAMAVTASVLMMVFAAAACDPKQTLVRLGNISFLSPVLAALMIWVAVYVGRAIGGDSLIAASAAAFVMLAALYAIEAVVSGFGLLAVSRGRAAPGAAIVALIHGKYAGLFGRIS
jgi:hypothetical protein